MYTEVTMIVRYFLMVLFGYFIQKGMIDGSLMEPLIGLGLAIFAYLWKKFETKVQKRYN